MNQRQPEPPVDPLINTETPVDWAVVEEAAADVGCLAFHRNLEKEEMKMSGKSILGKSLKKAAKKKPKRKEPLWKGPEVDGVTQSMLSTFLVCRERFRVKYIEGLQPVDTFNHRIEFGNMWHLCEEIIAAHPDGVMFKFGKQDGLTQYAQKLCKRYPLQQEQIEKWYNVCKVQFSIHIAYWKKNGDKKQSKSLIQEGVFDVPYELPSGRIVRLRGKWDDVVLEGKGKNACIRLGEHKTKSDIKEDQMQRQLTFDLQTMIYLIALQIYAKITSPDTIFFATTPITGVNYNVVRRPLRGGKGSIRQHKPTKAKPRGESTEDFYKRLGVIIAEEPESFFMRWRVEVSQSDIDKFKREFLNPILEQLCDWYEHIERVHDSSLLFDGKVMGTDTHWRTPFGIYNVLAEGGSTDVDEYLNTGSTVGLERTDSLFEELR